ncbi:hypothetical protein ABC977_15125 [Thioalkalicoccus limnaeus]|uniref:MIP18 family-like domain-containing protein n=1 Tax=Thioalkalicoccus limnaeus TaxID=120681 RepID=A0ABV4BMN3_9GAMM
MHRAGGHSDMTNADSDQVRELLRQVAYPGFSRDIVAAGFVGEILAVGPMVEVEFKPNTRDESKVAAMEREIRETLQGAAFADIQIRRVAPFIAEVPLRSSAELAKDRVLASDIGLAKDLGGHLDGGSAMLGGGRPMTPLQAELLEDGELPEADLLAVALGRVDVAAKAGYGPGGPSPLSGPREALAYDTGVDVLQWEIDPQDPDAQTFQTEIRLADWDYRIWWQVHPNGDLLYVSLQAMREDWVDHDNNAVPHPIGRSEAVNLVFDETRHAVVAIYGTVRDFRPFVKAFSIAYSEQSDSTDGPTTKEAHEQ